MNLWETKGRWWRIFLSSWIDDPIGYDAGWIALRSVAFLSRQPLIQSSSNAASVLSSIAPESRDIHKTRNCVDWFQMRCTAYDPHQKTDKVSLISAGNRTVRKRLNVTCWVLSFFSSLFGGVNAQGEPIGIISSVSQCLIINRTMSSSVNICRMCLDWGRRRERVICLLSQDTCNARSPFFWLSDMLSGR